MAKSTNTSKPEVTEEDLPVVRSVGWHKTKKGYEVFLLESQGMKILKVDRVTKDAVSKLEAENTLKVAVVKYFILDEHPRAGELLS